MNFDLAHLKQHPCFSTYDPTDGSCSVCPASNQCKDRTADKPNTPSVSQPAAAVGKYQFQPGWTTTIVKTPSEVHCAHCGIVIGSESRCVWGRPPKIVPAKKGIFLHLTCFTDE
jgi:hypothetical protein